jgi:hypothetical protein
MKPYRSRLLRTAATSAIVLALGAAAMLSISAHDGFSTMARAETDGSGQGGKPADAGNQGDGQQGQNNQGQGEGQGGPGEDSDGKGPQAGGPSDSGGGKPVWAQEGIPEVELGRLNVARSPDQVLDRALAEATKSLTPEMVAFYNLPLNDAISTLSLQFDEVAFIDSPLQNLALLQDLLEGNTTLADAGVTSSTGTLAALLLGAASDKTVPISPDTVVAVTAILGVPLTDASAASLAAAAEAVRIAILAGHG